MSNVLGEDGMMFSKPQIGNYRIYFLLLFIILAQAVALIASAQNLGGQPAFDKSVQGQTAAQPEGAFLNLVNWIGNVIAPVGAALCVVMAVVNYTHGRGVARWAIAAVGLLMVSGLTRLLESWITQGQGGVQ
jgi:hypothetical protein